MLARCLDSAAELVDDFAAARNESFSHASMDYCLWLDADDVIEPDLENHRRYGTLKACFEECYTALLKTYDDLAAWK